MKPEELDKARERAVRALLRVGTNPDVAEDCASKAVCGVLSGGHLEKANANYVVKAAFNAVRRVHKRQNRERQFRVEYARGADPAPDISEKPNMAAIIAGLSTLPKDEWGAIHNIVASGMTYDAAAHAQSTKVSTVNNWKHRGVAKLKEAFGQASQTR